MVDNTKKTPRDRKLEDDRLKREENSEKQTVEINQKLDRFSGVFAVIKDNLIDQTNILRRALDLQIENIEKLERERLFSSFDRDNQISDQPISQQYTPIENSSQQTTHDPNASYDGAFRGSILGDLIAASGIWLLQSGIGAIRSAAASVAAGSLSAAILSGARTMLRVSILTYFAPAFGEFLGDFTAQSLSNLGTDQAFASEIGDIVGSVGWGAMIGAAFGRKWMLLGGIGGLAYALSDELMNALGIDENTINNIAQNFGMNLDISEETFDQIAGYSMAGLAIALSRSLLNKSIWTSMWSGLSSTARFLGPMRLLGSGLLGAVAGLTSYFGDEIINWLGNQGIPTDIASITIETTNATLYGASLGAMFGPQGALIGAALGFVFGIGSSLVSWLDDMRQENERIINDEISQASPEDVLEAVRSGNYEQFQQGRVASRNAIFNSLMNAVENIDLTSIMDSINESDQQINYHMLDLFDRFDYMINEQIENMTREEALGVYEELSVFMGTIRRNQDNRQNLTNSQQEILDNIDLDYLSDLASDLRRIINPTEISPSLTVPRPEIDQNHSLSVRERQMLFESILGDENRNMGDVQSTIDRITNHSTINNIINMNYNNMPVTNTPVNVRGGSTNIQNSNAPTVISNGGSSDVGGLGGYAN